MKEITRSEADEALAQAEIDSIEYDEVVEALKRFYMFGSEYNIPYCELTDDDIIDEYEDTFGEKLKLI